MEEKEDLIQELVVDEACKAQRVDIYLANLLTDFSRSRIQAIINEGRVEINQQPCRSSAQVNCGDKITLRLPSSGSGIVSGSLVPVKMDLDILFEDSDIIVLNKPAGLVVHPGAGTKEPTLADGLAGRLQEQMVGEYAQLLTSDGFRPGIVHRLDKDTSGIMVCAKTRQALEHLGKQFEEKSNLREYVALLDGVMKAGEIVHSSYLHRDPRVRTRFASITESEFAEIKSAGKRIEGYRFAKSEFFRKKIYGERYTLAFIRLHTGRTHQIRVHAKDLSMPVLGDPLYAKSIRVPKSFSKGLHEELKSIKRQMLHARVLGFEHPVTHQKMGFEAPLPPDFRRIVEALERSRQE